jgi:Zn-dependent protease
MGSTKWRLFKVLGHTVYMTPVFLVIMALLAFQGVNTAQQLLVGLLYLPVLFIGILLHELGHAEMSKKLGFGTSEVMFWGLGGLAINRASRRRTPKESIAIALAGPAVSLLLGLASGAGLYAWAGGFSPADMFGQFLYLMMSLNLFWAVFNLLPIYPMDGGQATRSALELVMKRRRKDVPKFTGVISLVTLALALGVASVALRPDLFMVFLALYFGWINVKLIRQGDAQMRWY